MAMLQGGLMNPLAGAALSVNPVLNPVATPLYAGGSACGSGAASVASSYANAHRAPPSLAHSVAVSAGGHPLMPAAPGKVGGAPFCRSRMLCAPGNTGGIMKRVRLLQCAAELPRHTLTDVRWNTTCRGLFWISGSPAVQYGPSSCCVTVPVRVGVRQCGMKPFLLRR